MAVEFRDSAVSGADLLDQRAGFTGLLAWCAEVGVRTIIRGPRQASEKAGPDPVRSRDERQVPPAEDVPADTSDKSEPHAQPINQGGGPMDVDPSGVELTQDGVAWAFAAAVRGRLVFDHTFQQWFHKEGARWSLDAKAHNAARRCAAHGRLIKNDVT